jgi:ABC-type Zn uptake system ZnuABC Zn-binding protein ZnuA
MEQIAREAGVKIGPPLYSDALGQPGTEGESYLKMMRYNVQAIVKALGQ